jgi:carboxypeptidase Q
LFIKSNVQIGSKAAFFTIKLGKIMKKTLTILLGIGLCVGLWAQDAANPTINTAIRKHGLEKSKVMEIASWMTDVYGPRVTGSPMLDKATEWAQKTLKEWGMEQVHTEAWGPFGRGWEFTQFQMHATAPNYFPIIGYPKVWSPSTKGLISGEVVYLKANDEADLAAFKGKIKGKFVFLDTIRNTSEWFEGPAKRYNSEDLLNMANSAAPPRRPDRDFNRLGGFTFNAKLMKFLHEEEPLAIIDRSFKGDLGTVFVTGARAEEGRAQDAKAKVLPQATISVEHYNRILRLMQKGIPVTLSMELKANYTNPDGMEHNIIAEIPGTDLKDEVVIFGAHFDSWQSGTGATDNAAGSAVMMEAARILLETIKETGIKPRRTLRLALWTGEEQGLLGSRGYVKDHYSTVGPDGTVQGPKEPDNSRVSGYYNMDNGTGKIRGVYLQGNPGVMPIFRAWLDPFKDLGAATLTLQNTGGTDHQSFDAAGIPGFQFIQDPMAYSTRTHHSNMDNFDHLVEDDLKQAATIIASFVFHTAQRDEKLPRKPVEPARRTAGGN